MIESAITTFDKQYQSLVQEAFKNILNSINQEKPKYPIKFIQDLLPFTLNKKKETQKRKKRKTGYVNKKEEHICSICQNNIIDSLNTLSIKNFKNNIVTCTHCSCQDKSFFIMIV